ncbi:Glycine betaine transporter OpuD [Pseudovibrio axinellae]|uniref:Glycine betaine transporter OpuD n=1 Tax=Pseudovibrio axinellae TaxID=989403 RepID=A0A165SY46_9HYPH|nr:Glycine betaine transporter OpuD [Pseudovibrio axinellae]SER64709.1 Choline-glycine betaine transporter [Pseudovibrio axinellae]
MLFCLVALFDLELLSTIVDQSFDVAATYFGLFWQVFLLLTFLVSLLLCLLPGSRAVMGGTTTPDFTLFQWVGMTMCTLLAGGGVFWAAGEPIAHLLSPPPIFNVEPDTVEALNAALAQSFLHWGFLAWAILGSLSAIMLMHYHYDKGLPLAPRTLLYPVLGERAIHGTIGLLADALCVIAVVAGTVGPIGFLGLQLSYGLHDLFNIPDTLTTQSVLIVVLVIIYTISAISGLTRGIQLLSRMNVILITCLLLYILIAGPGAFILKSFFSGYWFYLKNFFDMALYRGEAGIFGPPGWLGWWTVFFWAWFLGYGPMMAVFIARISRGRSIRSIILLLSVVAPVLTNVWFAIIGGAGLAFELQQVGSISAPFEGFNLPAALLAISSQLPFGLVISILFLILTTVFVATTGDSMTYVISSTMSREGAPATPIRVFWGIAMGLMAIILISVGTGGISKLQSFIVITAVPVSILLVPSIWDALRITLMKGRTQS